LAVIAVALVSLGMGGSCTTLVIRAPVATTLHQAGNVYVEIALPLTGDPATLVVNLDNGTTTTSVVGMLSRYGTTVSAFRSALRG
jgi:hypothetical protein